MASITPGTGGTCKSTTAEGQLQEILSYICLKQAQATHNPGGVTNVTGIHNQQTLTFAGTYRFTVSQAIDASGHLVLTTEPYLVGTNFTPGTGGTFKANTPEGYALEVLMYIQNLERTASLNPQNRNLISGSYNSETGRYEGSYAVPVQFNINADSGIVSYADLPYLL